MDSNSGGGFFTGVIITLIVVSLIWGIGSSGEYEDQTAEEWYNEYDSCDSNLTQYKDALQEANDNIDQANSNVEGAKGNLGGNYADLEYGLDNLETVETVSEP